MMRWHQVRKRSSEPTLKKGAVSGAVAFAQVCTDLHDRVQIRAAKSWARQRKETPRKLEISAKTRYFSAFMKADRQGFKPSLPVRALRFSRPVHGGNARDFVVSKTVRRGWNLGVSAVNFTVRTGSSLQDRWESGSAAQDAELRRRQYDVHE